MSRISDISSLAEDMGRPEDKQSLGATNGWEGQGREPAVSRRLRSLTGTNFLTAQFHLIVIAWPHVGGGGLSELLGGNKMVLVGDLGEHSIWGSPSLPTSCIQTMFNPPWTYIHPNPHTNCEAPNHHGGR